MCCVSLCSGMDHVNLRDSPEEFCASLGKPVCDITNVVKAGQALHILEDWKIINGFVKVASADGVQGFIRARHIKVIWHNVRYVELNDRAWYPNVWMLDTSHEQCWIRVSEATPQQLDDVDIEALGHSWNPDIHDSLFSNGYTYVSLEVGRPRRHTISFEVGRPRGLINRSHRHCHLTIGYASPMEPGDRDRLRRALSNLLSHWLWTHPGQRRYDHNIFYARRFHLLRADRSPDDWMAWYIGRIVMRNATELEELLDNGRIVDVHFDPEVDGDFKDHIRKLYKRDNDRFHDAEVRAAGLQPHSGWLAMQHRSDGKGLTESSRELHDLMEYLGDRLFYYFPAQFRVPVRNVATGPKRWKLRPPFCADPTRWHCTRQGDWASEIHDLIFDEIDAIGTFPLRSSPS